MASYIFKLLQCGVSLHASCSFIFPTPTSITPSHLLGDYLKNTARVCRVDIKFCTSGTLHALDSTRFMLWLYTLVMMCSKLLDKVCYQIRVKPQFFFSSRTGACTAVILLIVVPNSYGSRSCSHTCTDDTTVKSVVHVVVHTLVQMIQL